MDRSDTALTANDWNALLFHSRLPMACVTRWRDVVTGGALPAS
jgi:hypothetical protein